MSHGFHVDGEGSDEASHSPVAVIRLEATPTLQVKGVAGYEGVEALLTKSEN